MNSDTITTLFTSGLYYLLIIPMALLSAFGIYVFIRYGRSRTVTITISLIYIILFVSLLSSSFTLLQSL